MSLALERDLCATRATALTVCAAIFESAVAMTQVNEYLNKLGLSQYSKNFQDEGFDTMQALNHVRESDLEAMGMKRGHRATLIGSLSGGSLLVASSPSNASASGSGSVAVSTSTSTTPA